MQSHSDDKPPFLELAEAALELVWPTRCACCERPGTLLCSSCLSKLKVINNQSACPFCGAPYGKVVCTECYSRDGKHTYPFASARSAFEMDELSGRIVVLYKDSNEHRLSDFIARSMLSQIPEQWLSEVDTVTWIPADKKKMRQRGFDHMERIAKEFALLANLPSKKYLDKQPSQDQRNLNRLERGKNLEKSFTLSPSFAAETIPQGLILIDDVFTTGATLEAAAAKLKEGGVETIHVASFARVW